MFAKNKWNLFLIFMQAQHLSWKRNFPWRSKKKKASPMWSDFRIQLRIRIHACQKCFVEQSIQKQNNLFLFNDMQISGWVFFNLPQHFSNVSLSSNFCYINYKFCYIHYIRYMYKLTRYTDEKFHTAFVCSVYIVHHS